MSIDNLLGLEKDLNVSFSFLKEEKIGKEYTIRKIKENKETIITDTLNRLIVYFNYTLTTGKRNQSTGKSKEIKSVNLAPETIQELVQSLNNACYNKNENSKYELI